MIIYHGSTVMVEQPEYGFGRLNNDYGQGFYCTEDMELAREWACRDDEGGFVNKYDLDISGLKVLDIEDLGILPWISILMKNRAVRYSSPVERRGAEFVISKYLPSYEDYDIIRGYRADDSYFTYTRAFLSGVISLEQLERAVRLGDLGIQICLKSPDSFERIYFLGADEVDGNVYYPQRVKRDDKARSDYYKLLEEESDEGIFIRDIMRKGDLGHECSI